MAPKKQILRSMQKDRRKRTRPVDLLEEKNPRGFFGGQTETTIFTSADHLNDVNWQTVQRQALVAQMSRAQGNTYLQRFLDPLEARNSAPAYLADSIHPFAMQGELIDSPIATVQRKIMIAGPSKLYGTALPNSWNELSQRTQEEFLRRNRGEFSVNGKLRLRLAQHILADMTDSSVELQFSDEHELTTEVKKRLITAYMMRISQGVPIHGQWQRAFSYPNRGETKKCGPRVNEAALAYWGPVQGIVDDYYFELSAAGRVNAYDALQSLFVLQHDPCKRTLIHCDYLTSVLHYKAFAETLGREEFNRRVANGELPLTLKWNGFDDIIAGTAPSADATSLQEIRVNRREDLIIGDHVVFHNHPMYDALIEGIGGVWRLENAILVDRKGGTDLFQGHGYTTPVTEQHMKQSMLGQITKVVNAVRALISRSRHGSRRQRESAYMELYNYKNVQKVGNKYRVIGTAFEGSFNIPVDTPLRIPSMDELPGLRDPRDLSQFYLVKRPVESQ